MNRAYRQTHKTNYVPFLIIRKKTKNQKDW